MEGHKKYFIVNFREDDSVVAINWKANFDSGTLILGPSGSNTVKVYFGKEWYKGEIVGERGKR